MKRHRGDPLAILGARIRHARNAVGWSQRRLAAETGLWQDYICGYETARGRWPSVPELMLIADALDLPGYEVFLSDADLDQALKERAERKRQRHVADGTPRPGTETEEAK
jgi:transcriptional regulator with XRE-family HTH domain